MVTSLASAKGISLPIQLLESGAIADLHPDQVSGKALRKRKGLHLRVSFLINKTVEDHHKSRYQQNRNKGAIWTCEQVVTMLIIPVLILNLVRI